MGRPQAVVSLAAIAAAAGITVTETAGIRHESYHQKCYECRDMEGYSEKDANHDDCTGKCAETNSRGPDCAGPCPCPCSEPMSKNELMKLRSLLDKLSNL